MNDSMGGKERREFARVEYVTPLAYKICKRETIDKLLEGYTADVSQSGIFCRIKDDVQVDDILWLSFDKDTLDFCHDMEKRCFMYQGGVIGCVVRMEGQDENGMHKVGLRFITREEGHVLIPRIILPPEQA